MSRLAVRQPAVRSAVLATLGAAACAGAAVTATPAPALAQGAWHAGIAAGPADVRQGAVGHLGVRWAPGGAGGWAEGRADATLGRLGGQPARAGTLGVEVGPPTRLTPGLRAFGLVGVTAVRTGPRPSVDRGLMAGAGLRARVGRVWLSAEQRFQPGFSPLLVGLSL